MKTAIPLLADIRVASPCHAAWGNMKGDEQTRFCGLCRKNVYNLSEMTRQEAENLIREKEGKLCVRYYQRADGTVLTKDCPIGAMIVRRLLLTRAVSASALLVTVIALFGKNLRFAAPPVEMGAPLPIEQSVPAEYLGGLAAEAPEPEPFMGKVANWTSIEEVEPPVPQDVKPVMGSVASLLPILPKITPVPPKIQKRTGR